MDTQQAYTVIPLTDWMTTNDTVGGLHPNSVGYQAQADWMYGFFPPPIDPVPVIITDSLTSLTRGVGFSQVIMSSSVGVWSVVDGVLPSGLSLNSTTGEISGTPLAYGGNYDFTIRVTNDAGHDQRRFTGIIDSSTMLFDPKGLAKTKWRMLEHYYFIAARIRTGGEFKHLTPRD
jgi:hypothetical protein